MEKITIVLKPPKAYIGDIEVKLIDYSESLESQVECTFQDLTGVQACNYPKKLITDILDMAAEDIPFFEGSQLYRWTEDWVKFYVSFSCPDLNWRYDIQLDAIARELKELVSQPHISPVYSTFYIKGEDSLSITAKIPLNEEDLTKTIRRHIQEVEDLLHKAERNILGFQWDSRYEKDERAFTKGLLIPLLQKMGFLNVSYHHGSQEFGRDVLFSEPNSFGVTRHSAMQVKVGNISGSSNSLIDKIIGQIADAFSMPVEGPGVSRQFYISELYIVTSGKFCENAIKKINQKIPVSLQGSVIFLDKDDVEWLVKKYWPLY